MARGALGTDPRKKQNQNRGGGQGALAVDPRKGGFKVGGNIDAINSQIAKLEAIAQKKGAGNAPVAQKRLEQLYAERTKLGGGEASIPAGEMPADFNSVTGQGNEAMSNIFNQIQKQGEFNPGQYGMESVQQFQPGDYSQMRQQAEGTVMDSFNRRMQPQFQQEQAQFEQRMAEQGIPVGSELYNKQLQQMQQSQGDQRQNAMNQAFQMGQGEQAQGFGQQLSGFQANLAQQGQGWNQAFQQYQLPLAQLNAMTPYYNVQGQMQMQQGQQDWMGQQAELDRQNQMQQLKYNRGTAWGAPRGGGGGGGGGLSFEQQMALQDRGFFNNMVANGMANGNMSGGDPNYGANFGAGMAAGGLMGMGLRS